LAGTPGTNGLNGNKGDKGDKGDAGDSGILASASLFSPTLNGQKMVVNTLSGLPFGFLTNPQLVQVDAGNEIIASVSVTLSANTTGVLSYGLCWLDPATNQLAPFDGLSALHRVTYGAFAPFTISASGVHPVGASGSLSVGICVASSGSNDPAGTTFTTGLQNGFAIVR
jgi:hypothetical protein